MKPETTQPSIEDMIKVSGTYYVKHFRKGLLIFEEIVKNIVTNVGKAQLALLAGDSTAIPFTDLALGTSNTAVAATDTTLTAEITDSGLARAVGTVTRVTTTTTNDTLQISYLWTSTGTKTVQEVGVFNASVSGTMLSHALPTAASLVPTDMFMITYQLKFS